MEPPPWIPTGSLVLNILDVYIVQFSKCVGIRINNVTRLIREAKSDFIITNL